MKIKWPDNRQFLFYVLFLWLVLLGLSFMREYRSIVIIQQVDVSIVFLLIRGIVNWSVILIYIFIVYYLSIVAPVHDKLMENIKWHVIVLLIGLIIIPFWFSLVYYWARGDMQNPYPLNFVYGINFRYKILVLPFLHAFIVIGQWVLSIYRQDIADRTSDLRQRSRLVKSKLRTLKAKLNPHFLFNTLQGINTVAYHDQSTAHDMLLVLKDIFTKVDERSEKVFVTVFEEMEFTRKYLYLEKKRFRDKLNVDFKIDKETGNLDVPKFILQPVIENSIKHVMANKIHSSHVRIHSFVNEGDLYITIEDSGLPNMEIELLLEKLNNGNMGYGLKNIAERLNVIGNGASITFERSPLGGLKNIICLPALT